MKNNSNPEKIGVAEQVKAATDNVNQLRSTMLFVTPLSADERAQLGRLGQGGLRLIQVRCQAVCSHPGSLPTEFDVDGFTRDANTLKSLEELLGAVDRMRSDVRDTILDLGTRTARAAQEAYQHLRVDSIQREHLQETVAGLSRPQRRRRRTPAAAETTPADSQPPAVVPANVTPDRAAGSSEPAVSTPGVKAA